MGVVLFGSAAPIVFRVGIVIGFRTSGRSDSLIIKMLSCRSFLKVLLGSFRSYHMIVIVFLRVRMMKISMGYIFPRRLPIVCLIWALHFLFFFFVQIVTFAGQYFFFQLCIDLLVVLPESCG